MPKIGDSDDPASSPRVDVKPASPGALNPGRLSCNGVHGAEILRIFRYRAAGALYTDDYEAVLGSGIEAGLATLRAAPAGWRLRLRKHRFGERKRHSLIPRANLPADIQGV